MDENLKFKVSMLGDSGVGKSSIILRKTNNSFSEETSATVGTTTAKITEDIGEALIDLLIWDTAGQEKFHSLSPFYISNSNAIIFVYAVNDDVSFQSIDKWYDIARNNLNTVDPYFILVANKNDLINEENAITYEKGKNKADSLQMDFLSVSAKLNDDIDLIVQIIAQNIFKKTQKKEAATETNSVHLINDQNNANEKKSCC